VLPSAADVRPQIEIRGKGHSLLAEEAVLVGFDADGHRLRNDDLPALIEAAPDGDLPDLVKRRQLSAALTRLPELTQILDEFRRKLLGFTDNRQDAALQAGHFNDFVFVTRLRAAILASLARAGDAGAVEAEIASSLQNALGFVRAREDRRPDWLQEPELKGAHLINAEADLRAVLLHRFWVDQRRGWRFTHPNLEELGFVRAEYVALGELACDEAAFSDASPRLKAAFD
jgi:hypothetical protein